MGEWLTAGACYAAVTLAVAGIAVVEYRERTDLFRKADAARLFFLAPAWPWLAAAAIGKQVRSMWESTGWRRKR